MCDFPAELVNADIQRGQTKFSLSDSGMLAVKYRAQDKANIKPKIVDLLSTAHSNDTVASNKKDKDGNAVMKPSCVECVLNYNKCMGGVDLMD